MDDPFRLRVLKALTETLKDITPSNGFNTDFSDFTAADGMVSERVIRGRDRFGDGDEVPFLSILEDFRPEDQQLGREGATEGKGEWRLLIQGFVKDHPNHPTDHAYHAAADVIRALVLARKERYNLLGLGSTMPCVTDIQFKQPVVRPADNEISSTSFFFITLKLTLVENLENPFA